MSVERVKEITEKKHVVIFMKGDRNFPQCGFSARAIEVLRAAGVEDQDLETFDVLSDPDVRNSVKELTRVPTIPQVFVGGEFIGTGDVIYELLERGELKEIVQKA